ncbi:MAG TPA: putative peptidoglycan-binding domain-containing protein [Acidobacteriaceae bacterium]|jgi:lysozyme family protein|nr:putative peptidoglycan-binding domain-containing protein [Acidobacteriaceae bacterium]
MANQDVAISYALSFEDSKLTGVITTNDDGVTKTRYGIDQRFHQDLGASGFFKDMGSIAALQIAKGVYAQSYCLPLCITEISNQDIANKLLSLGINIGVKPVSKFLQDAVGVTEDGVIGVQTLMKLSSADSLLVLTDLRASAERFYYADVAANPDKQKDLKGWLARARA